MILVAPVSTEEIARFASSAALTYHWSVSHGSTMALPAVSLLYAIVLLFFDDELPEGGTAAMITAVIAIALLIGTVLAAVRHAADISGYTAREIVSGASHDASYVSRVAPSAMVFVPCRGGISHNEAEFSSKEQCAKGAQVLLQAVLDYDRKLAERDAKPGG